MKNIPFRSNIELFSLGKVVFRYSRNFRLHSGITKLILSTFLLALFFLCFSLTHEMSNTSLSLYDNLLSGLETCDDFETRLASVDEWSDSMPSVLSSMLLFVDHTFVLSVDGCESKIPASLESRATCIVGRVLDRCTPARFVRGKYKHAMKVTFTHAMVLLISQRSGYRHVAVIEDDIKFVERKLSPGSVHDFFQLLQTNSWSLIRFGYRPYFLQDGGGATPCPMKCRCEINANMGDHLCKLPKAGCDLRSSDFYVVHSRHFLDLASRTLDMSVQNSQRIVDVYPMRAFSNQWLFLPQVSYQATLDIPADYQLGAGALYVKKCAGPRPLPHAVTQQFSSTYHNETVFHLPPPTLE